MNPGSGNVEVPVVVFPIRGRLNPYFIWLIPLIIFCIIASLCGLGSLIASCLIPFNVSLFNQLAPPNYKTAVVLAIIVYSVEIGLCALIAALYGAILFNFLDSKFTPFLLDVLVCVAIGFFVPISVLAIVAEAALDPAVFGVVVTQYALLSAGLIGLSAVFFLVGVLLLSRFYQLCIGVYKYQKREVLQAAELAATLNPYKEANPGNII